MVSGGWASVAESSPEMLVVSNLMDEWFRDGHHALASVDWSRVLRCSPPTGSRCFLCAA